MGVPVFRHRAANSTSHAIFLLLISDSIPAYPHDLHENLDFMLKRLVWNTSCHREFLVTCFSQGRDVCFATVDCDNIMHVASAYWLTDRSV
jgi:hypothetical protein